MNLEYRIHSGSLPPNYDWGELHHSKERALQFYQSRYALQQAYLDDNPGNPLTWQDLKIIDHLFIENYPDLLASLSHTKGISAAVIGKKSKDRLSVGIDVEWSDRHLKKGAEKFFMDQKDDTQNYSPLELWSLKEAAFKAISPLLKEWPYKRFVLKHIWVQGENFGLIKSELPIGKLKLVRKLIEARELLISLAELKKLPNN